MCSSINLIGDHAPGSVAGALTLIFAFYRGFLCGREPFPTRDHFYIANDQSRLLRSHFASCKPVTILSGIDRIKSRGAGDEEHSFFSSAGTYFRFSERIVKHHVGERLAGNGVNDFTWDPDIGAGGGIILQSVLRSQRIRYTAIAVRLPYFNGGRLPFCESKKQQAGQKKEERLHFMK